MGGKDAGAVRRNGNRRRHRGARAKVGFGRGGNIGELAADVILGRDY